MTFELRLALAVFATFRLARLVTRDTIMEPFRLTVGRWASGSNARSFRWMIAELVNCPYCTGVWVSLVLAYFVAYPNQVADAFLVVLAIAGGQMFLQDRSNLE